MKPKLIDKIEFRNTVVLGEMLLSIVNDEPLVLILTVRESAKNGRQTNRRIKLNYHAAKALILLYEQLGHVIQGQESVSWTASLKYPAGGFMEARLTRFVNGAPSPMTKVKIANQGPNRPKETLVLFEKGIEALGQVTNTLRNIIADKRHQ